MKQGIEYRNKVDSVEQRSAVNREKCGMGMPQKAPLRSLTELEQQQLQRLTKASSERRDVVRCAKTLLALAQGHTFTEAGKQAGISR